MVIFVFFHTLFCNFIIPKVLIHRSDAFSENSTQPRQSIRQMTNNFIHLDNLVHLDWWCVYDMSLSAVTPVERGPRIPALEIISALMDYRAWRAQWGRASRAPTVIHRSQRLACIVRQKQEKDPELLASRRRALEYAVRHGRSFWPTAEHFRLQKSSTFSILAELWKVSSRSSLDGGLQRQPGWFNGKNRLVFTRPR